MAPEVSVVVAVHDARATLPVLLEALARQDCEESFEVILSDDASTDGGPALADGFAGRLALTVCHSPRRRGPGAARNAGAARARAPLLAFCDADDVPDRGWLRALCAATRVEPLVAGAVHHLNVPGRRMEPAELTAHYRHLPWTMTANLAISRELFEAVGGFAEVLRSGQDADLCWRLADRGVALGDAPSAIVLKRHRRGAVATFRQYLRYGRFDPLLYRRHRAAGMPRRSPAAVARHWAAGTRVAARALAHPRSPAVELAAAHWGLSLGRIMGSMRWRSLYL